MAIRGAEIDLILKLLRYDTTKRQLIDIKNSLNAIKSGATKINRATAALGWVMGKTFGAAKKAAVDFKRTLRTAVLRVVAYDLVNTFTNFSRNIIRGFVSAVNEAKTTLLNFARSSAIMSRQSGNFEDSYENIKRTLLDTSKNIGLTANQEANLALQLAKGGLRGKEYAKFMEALGKAHVITGESVNKLGWDMLRIQQAFGIPTEQLDKLVALVTTASTTAVGSVTDILQATKYLGPVFKIAYGSGLDVVKLFSALAMTFTAAGVKGSMGARWMRRAMVQLIAPSDKTARVLAQNNIQVYANTRAAQDFQDATRDLRENLDKLSEKEVELIKKRSEARQAGWTEKESEYSDQLKKTRKEIEKNVSSLLDQYKVYVKTGKVVRPIGDIISDLAKRAQVLGPVGFLNLLKEAFSIRSLQGVATLSVNIDKFNEIMSSLINTTATFNKMFKDIIGTAPGQLRAFETAWSKIKNLIGELGLETLWAPVGEALRTKLFDPLSNFLNSKPVQDLLKRTGQRVSEDVTKMLDIITHPDKYKGRVNVELKVAWDKFIEDIGKIVKPLIPVFKAFGVILGKAIAQGIYEAVSTPLAKLLVRTSAPKGLQKQMREYYNVGVPSPEQQYEFIQKVREQMEGKAEHGARIKSYAEYWKALGLKPNIQLRLFRPSKIHFEPLYKTTSDVLSDAVIKAREEFIKLFGASTEPSKPMANQPVTLPTTATTSSTTSFGFGQINNQYFIEQRKAPTKEVANKITEILSKQGGVVTAYSNDIDRLINLVSQLLQNERLVATRISTLEGQVNGVVLQLKNKNTSSR